MPADFTKLDISGYQTPLWILPKKLKYGTACQSI